MLIMGFSSLLRRLIPASPQAEIAGKRRRSEPRKPAVRLRLDRLEARDCPSYTVTDLGTLGGSGSSYAYGVNQAGQVVGDAYNGSTMDAFLWTPGATDGVPGNVRMKDLGTLGGTSTSGDPSSAALGINDVGQVVGQAYTAGGGPYHAFLWSVTGNPQMKDLGTLGGANSVATGINPTSSRGVQVVGWSDTDTGQRHAFLWQNGQMTDLRTLGGTDSEADGINDAGQVTGVSWLSGDSVEHAFLWTPGATDGVPGNPQMKDLGTLGGRLSNGQAINAGGQVAGSSLPKNGSEDNGFSWLPKSSNGTTGKMSDLGTLNLGGTVKQSDANGINDAGNAVGWSGSALGVLAHAFYWAGSGGIVDLNGLILNNPGFAYLENATGINNGGQIVGEGPFPTLSTPHAFLLTPSTAGQQSMVAIHSPGNMGLSPADLAGRPPGPADEAISGANGQAAFNDAANTPGGVWYVDQTRLNGFQVANTGERMARRNPETNDAGDQILALEGCSCE
jgi:probable HAF family extracellular repeat protein